MTADIKHNDTDRERARLALEGMVAFAQDVMSIQLANFSRKDTDYSEFSFDLACAAFLSGAMQTISEILTTPTAPREAAHLGLAKYLTEVKGKSFKEAQFQISLIYNSPDDSKAALLAEIGKEHWRNPDALKKYFKHHPAVGIESEEGFRQAERRRRLLIIACGSGLLMAGIAIYFALMH